ncbi:DUF551 domain-containing protein [Salmonella enterica subsp. diarizonae]|nr:DUF551 domain-containing protein [Salmonella enterica]EBE9032995.1 DUF551 domain-containing protein [Salmonella enterica]EBE9065159.1 DUF551 domain-containing protein [Salmonella enterica]EEO7476551.1 DUF551 domain-containing protein [Salmonella enterica subsp. diarizonae]EGV3636343.1 DUF551 domain-containing protein [Salmonella enterica]
MTTITYNKLTDERVSNATLIRLIQWADQHNSHYVAAALCELQERRKADSAEPAGYHVIKECGKVGCSVATLEEAEKTRDFWNKRWTIRPYFYTQPALVATGATNSPVTPDGWISCSERMPEDEQEVIVQNKLGYRYVSYFDEQSGLFFDMRGGNQINCIEHILVTHWMPLPAAPQEVNHG